MCFTCMYIYNGVDRLTLRCDVIYVVVVLCCVLYCMLVSCSVLYISIVWCSVVLCITL